MLKVVLPLPDILGVVVVGVGTHPFHAVVDKLTVIDVAIVELKLAMPFPRIVLPPP
jgi:hypothetical protein